MIFPKIPEFLRFFFLGKMFDYDAKEHVAFLQWLYNKLDAFMLSMVEKSPVGMPNKSKWTRNYMVKYQPYFFSLLCVFFDGQRREVVASLKIDSIKWHKEDGEVCVCVCVLCFITFFKKLLLLFFSYLQYFLLVQRRQFGNTFLVCLYILYLRFTSPIGATLFKKSAMQSVLQMSKYWQCG